MLSRNRRGINNLLIRRLRRHANLATLFRSMDAPRPARYQPVRAVAIPAYLVSAPPPSIEQFPLTTIKKQEEGVETAGEMEQVTWRRLQAIYNAHEQKTDSALEGKQSDQEEQVQPTGPGHIQRKAAQTAPQAKPPLIKTAGERTGPEPAQQAPDASDLAEQVTDYTDVLPADEAAPSQPVPLQSQPLQAAWPVQPLRPESGPKPGAEHNGEPVEEPSVEPGRRPEVTSEVPSLDRSRMQNVVEQIPSGKPSSSSVEQIPPRRPRPHPPLTPEARPLTEGDFEAAHGDVYERPPVEPGTLQRVEATAQRADAAERQPFSEAANAKTAAPLQDPGSEQPQATPPRERPADAPIPEVPGESPAPTLLGLGDASTAPQSQPSPPSQAPPDAPLASIQRRLNPQSGSQSARFKKPEGSPIDADLAAPAFVPTGLGPLPADLWDLLDQPRPAPERRRSPTGGQTQLAEAGVPDQGSEGENSPNAGRRTKTIPAPQALLQRAPHPVLAPPGQIASDPGEKTSPAGLATGRAETPLPSPSGAALAPSFENIQRRPAEIGEVPPPTQATPPGSGTGTGQEADVNLDELARRVYAEVRTRLALEWERLRR